MSGDLLQSVVSDATAAMFLRWDLVKQANEMATLKAENRRLRAAIEAICLLEDTAPEMALVAANALWPEGVRT